LPCRAFARLQPCYTQLMIETSEGIRISSFSVAVYPASMREENLR
jgi:hypothetical protein